QGSHKLLRVGSIRSPTALPRKAVRGRAFLSERLTINQLSLLQGWGGTSTMNYRHVFHAGNFADVFKHAVLARILLHLTEKPQPFRVIDTHAGSGLYDLSGEQANRTGEWREGIGRLIDASLAPDVRILLTPYLDAIAALNPPG